MCNSCIMIKLVPRSRNTLRNGKEEGYDICYPDGTIIWRPKHEVDERLNEKIITTESYNKLIEKLADIEHDSWSRWMIYLFSCSEIQPDGSYKIPPKKVARWKRQMNTEYVDLSEEEKESDRAEVRRFMEIIHKFSLI